MNQKAVCGNCEKAYNEHYFEHEVYCFTNTTGDIFTEEPNDNIVSDIIYEKHHELVQSVINEWKAENGH